MHCTTDADGVASEYSYTQLLHQANDYSVVDVMPFCSSE